MSAEGITDLTSLTLSENLVVTGTETITGGVTYAGAVTLGDESGDAITINGTTTANAPLTVGVDDTGYDVKFFGATAGKFMVWDESADDLILADGVALQLGGDESTADGFKIEFDGTSELNVSALTANDKVGFGSTQSTDVTFYGANFNLDWDASADSLTNNGTMVVANAGAAAFVVGANGVTNPALQVDASTASSVTGVQVKSKDAGGAAEISVLSSNVDESLKIDAKGSGNIDIGSTSTGSVILGGSIFHGGITTSSGPGAVSVAGRVHEVTTTGTGNALTLANAVSAGQRLTIIYVAEGAGGDTAVITPTTLAGGSTITLNNLGDSAELVYSDTGGWYVVGLGGAAAVA